MKKLLLLAAVIAALVLSLASCDVVDNVLGNGEDDSHIHTMGEWGNSSATCEAAGFEERVCTAEDCTYSEKRVAPALGHDIVTNPAKAPTCSTLGYEEHEYCTRCDYTTKVNIPTLEHNYVNGVCSHCGVEDVHEFGEWGGNTATCITTGTEKRTCSGCGYVEVRETVALGHNKVTVEGKAPDCTNTGWNAYEKCDREGCAYTTFVELKALGHDMGEYGNNTATCEHTGVETAECQREGCEHTEERETEKLPHTYGDDNYCEECGWYKYMLPPMPAT